MHCDGGDGWLNYLLALLRGDVFLELEQNDVDEGSNVSHCCDEIDDDGTKGTGALEL